jgi:riboflavin kinase / FMN adenylyltransferase
MIYSFVGTQIKGKGIGSKMVFPTINLATSSLASHIDHGIYASIVKVEDKKCHAAIHYGPKPTFDDNEISLEMYIIDDFPIERPKNIEYTVSLIKKIRPIIKFGNADLLKSQIAKDIIVIKYIIEEYNKNKKYQIE